MRASAEPVDGNRVRLSIEVDASEVADAMNATVRRLGRQVRVPGFRPGKVPRQVLEARLGGASALRQQAVQDLLPDLYARAVAETEVDPIAPPEIDVQGADEPGPLTVDAVVEVRPSVSVAGYQGLQVTVPAVEVTDEEIDRQIDRLREQDGELVAADRPAADGDVVTIDLHGSRPDGDDLDLADFVVEVGQGSALPGLDEHLRGVRPGDEVTFTVPRAGQGAADGGPGEADGGDGSTASDDTEDGGVEDAGAEGTDASSITADAGETAAAGDGLSVRVLVKEVQRKVLPEVTDAWAAEVSELDSVEALRHDLAQRLQRVKRLQASLLLRERTLEALVALVPDDPPASMVDAEVSERLHDLSHRLQERGMTAEQFLAASGRDEAGLVEELRGEARRAVLVDLALRAVADAEGIEVTDEDLDAAVAEMAAQVGTDPRDLRQRLERSGRLLAVRSERRKAKALEWLEGTVELVDDEGRPVDRDLLRGEDDASEDDSTGTVPGASGEDSVADGDARRSSEPPEGRSGEPQSRAEEEAVGRGDDATAAVGSTEDAEEGE
jgi:trigger factor